MPHDPAAPRRNIDWSGADEFEESECTCRCVFERLKDGDEIPTFRSHAKYVASGLVSRKPCPDCKRHDNLHRVSSGTRDG